jgi:hypothetical protein
MISRILCLMTVLCCLLAAKRASANTCTTCYIDYETGNDTWDGTSKTHTDGSIGPWKHAPGMLGLTPSNTSSGDGCASNCAAQSPKAGDKYILKGGVVWPHTTLPWWFTSSGSSSTQAYGCAGNGCIYIGNDPTWNKGIVNSVTLARDLGGCNPSSSPTVSISGGGGSGAAATALVMPEAAASVEPNVGGLLYQINLTHQGSGYTSNPTVTIGGGGCAGVTAVADIQRPVIDAGKEAGIDWPVGYGPGSLEYGPGILLTGSYVIVDHLEVRNILQVARAVNGVPDGIITAFVEDNGGSKGYNTFSNNYLHGRFSDCQTDTSTCDPGGNQEPSDRAIILSYDTDEAAGNTYQNGDSFFLGTSSNFCGNKGTGAPCEFSEHAIAGNGSIHGNRGYGLRWMVHSGGTPSQPLLVYDNELWLVLYDVGGAHENELYILLTTGTLYEYNNVFHSAVSGASNQQQMGNGTTHYYFNNVSWGTGGGTSNWGIDPSFGAGPAGGHFYFYNNTMYGEGSGTRDCIDTGSGPYNSALSIVLQNNHCITAANPYWNNEAAGDTLTNQAGSTTIATIEASSAAQSAAAAASQGYAISNVFAPLSSSEDTVTFATSANSANLDSICKGQPNPGLGALCYDINGTPRPATGTGWNAGAYQCISAPDGGCATASAGGAGDGGVGDSAPPGGDGGSRHDGGGPRSSDAGMEGDGRDGDAASGTGGCGCRIDRTSLRDGVWSIWGFVLASLLAARRRQLAPASTRCLVHSATPRARAQGEPTCGTT